MRHLTKSSLAILAMFSFVLQLAPKPQQHFTTPQRQLAVDASAHRDGCEGCPTPIARVFRKLQCCRFGKKGLEQTLDWQDLYAACCHHSVLYATVSQVTHSV